jgi:phosphohistidine phosphatase
LETDPATLKIWVLRHAKAEAEGPGGDFARSLTPRGRRQAKAVREHLAQLAETHELPSLVLSSPAARALETAEAVLPALPSARLQTEAQLYSQHADGVVKLLRELDPEERALMVVGHNPTLYELCMMLATPAGSKTIESAGLSTAGLVVLAFAGVARWSGLVPGEGELVLSFRPHG